MTDKRTSKDPYRLLLLVLIVAASAFRIYYIQWGPLDLSPEEAQYWDWSRRLDLSYYSKGPVIAYVIALFTSIIGTGELGVRMGAVIISAATTVVIFVFTERLSGSSRAAFFASLVPALTPIFSAGGILMTTDTPAVFFWALALLSFHRAVEEEGLIHWVLLGVFTALGLLTKYTMGVIYPCILLYLLFSARDRRWLGRREPYIALAISLLCFVPEVVWNARHDWITFKHVLGQTHAKEGFRLSFSDFLGFSGAQVGILTPFIFLGVIYGIVKSGVRGLGGERSALLLFLTSAPILAFFLAKSFQAKVEANWAVLAYYSGIIAGAVMIERALSQRRGVAAGLIKACVVVSLATGLLVTSIAHYPGILRSFGVNLRKTPVMMLQGWRELGERTAEVLGETGDKTFIMSDRYQITSELAFYVPSRPVTYNINLGRRMNQYDIWEGFYTLVGWNSVYVKWSFGELEEEVSSLFERCEAEEPLEIVRGGRVIRTFYIYRCYGFKGMEKPEFVKW